jgi:hypothetical protein
LPSTKTIIVFCARLASMGGRSPQADYQVCESHFAGLFPYSTALAEVPISGSTDRDEIRRERWRYIDLAHFLIFYRRYLNLHEEKTLILHWWGADGAHPGFGSLRGAGWEGLIVSDSHRFIEKSKLGSSVVTPRRKQRFSLVVET